MNRSAGRLPGALAAAALAVALASAAGLLRLLVLRYEGPDLASLEHLRVAGRLVWWASILYLLVTAGVVGRLGLMLRRGDALQAPVAPLLAGGHLVVVVAIGCGLLRQTQSIALLAELDQVLTIVGIVSALALLLCLAVWWTLPQGQVRATDSPSRATPLPATQWIRWTIQVIACLLLAISLILLESLPPSHPHIPSAGQAAPAAEARA